MKEQIHLVFAELARIRDTSGNPFWNLGRDAAMFMNVLVRATAAQRVLEIGTSNGLSALVMADALIDTGGHLWTIESHKERYFMALDNFTRAGVVDSIVTLVNGHAPEDIPDVGPFDLVLMDATKIEALSHYKTVRPMCRSGAVIVTDNIYSHAEELGAFLSFVKKQSDVQNTELYIGTGMLVTVTSGVFQMGLM